jgi:glyoxylase-like metal-dependent hydrolase (beta-lactamase superfamily II)
MAAAAGIQPFVLDTPFKVGTVNTYLIEDDPMTPIDCRPSMATVLSRLEELLAARSYALADLQLVVVTHQHVDHTGLAGSSPPGPARNSPVWMRLHGSSRTGTDTRRPATTAPLS